MEKKSKLPFLGFRRCIHVEYNLKSEMRQIYTVGRVVIPPGVEIEAKARVVKVTGERGTLQRDFRHLHVDLYLMDEEDGTKVLRVEVHFSKRKQVAAIRTTCSHVTNMITGVTKGFQYKLRLVYAHFPINVVLEEDGKRVEIRNFLGEKRLRVVQCLPGVKCIRDGSVKDQLILEGNDLELVSRSAALIHQSCLVKKKDIRKFLDGIYVTAKGNVVGGE
eukprot:TRINITY_DN2437_c0_g1_i1.p2 TRINITY_DN2437_c0_g1~~TRINITY_DN2437_c0_g1_i1.p2  ORF type:complete len:230 (-),score=24.53 TRINITY_DN2437_c0_g1_i1:184-840(-)